MILPAGPADLVSAPSLDIAVLRIGEFGRPALGMPAQACMRTGEKYTNYHKIPGLLIFAASPIQNVTEYYPPK